MPRIRMSFEELRAVITGELQNPNVLDPFDPEPDYEYAQAEQDILPNMEHKQFFYNVIDIISSSISNEIRTKVLKSLMLEIDRLSWQLFEENKICGADCVNVFSPKAAKIFDMFNILTDNIKFNNKNNYVNNGSYFIGELNNKYKVFMPKKITRIVLSENINNQDDCSEKFISEKWNMIELYNSEMPENKFTIKLENLQ